MKIDLAGRVAIVTGGAKGIGLAISRTLSEAGATVDVADANVERATPELLGYSPGLVVRTDISVETSVQDLFAQVMQRFQKVDIVVNCAGIYRMIPILDIDVADWDRVLGVNLRGTFLMGREAFRVMKERRSGKIINIASIAGKVGSVTAGAHYSASKAGVISFTKTLAFQSAEFRINVNAVCPGPIETEMIGEWNPESNKAYAARIPWKEFGKPQDVADAVTFLASDQARYITGEILDVNGGLLMD
jgi:NAD(P)-dependent dehydrogenase (short-subunit alcohol dehydrogenase family)